MDEYVPPDLDPKLKDALKGIEGEFEMGKMTLMEFLELYAPKILNAWNAMKWDDYFVRLQQGESTAVLVMAFSLIAGGLVAKRFLSVVFPSDEAPSALKNTHATEALEEEEIVLRDFTLEQLRENDGLNEKPIYIALRREVFDVSNATDFYGQGCSYHCFAGREASRAMAKMSFDEADLAEGMHIDDLGPFDRSILEDWYQKFKYYKCYPVVGKVSEPAKDIKLTRAQLAKFNGKQEIPADRVDAPIYIAIKGNILDVSYGGKDFYSGESGYAVLAGKDASRALAKMSLDAADVDSADISDLTEEQMKVLNDWEVKLSKKYPCVGCIVEGVGGDRTDAGPGPKDVVKSSASTIPAAAAAAVVGVGSANEENTKRKGKPKGKAKK